MFREIDREFQGAVEEGWLHGMVVTAGRAGGKEFTRALGLAALEPRRAEMRAGAVFDLASVTKVVATSTACAICADEGLLDPEAPVSEYLPGIGAWPGRSMRVRDLASHYSGFDNRKFHLFSPRALIRKAIESPAQGPPGERYIYSCRNFIVLGELVRKLTGAKLDDFCKTRVFEPLDLRDTAFGPLVEGLDHVVPTNLPAGQISDEQARAANTAIGNAGLFGNARDLARFATMLLGGGELEGVRILGEAGLRLLTTPCSPAGEPERSFGWDMRPPGECPHRPSGLSRAAIGHSGWTGQSLWLDPDSGLYAVVLTNRTHAMGEPAGATHAPSAVFRSRIADLALKAVW